MRCSRTGATGVTRKYNADPRACPLSKGAGKPPGATEVLLTKVTRTNPQVALGFSCSRFRISFAVRFPAMVVTGSVCALAEIGDMRAAPASTALRSARRRPTPCGLDLAIRRPSLGPILHAEEYRCKGHLPRGR